MSNLAKKLPENISTTSKRSSVLTRLLKAGVFHKLENLKYGSLEIRENDKTFTFGDLRAGLKVSLRVTSEDFYWSIATNGSIGAAESYVRKEWEADDLTNLIRLFALNRNLLTNMDAGLVNIQKPLRAVDYWRRQNSKGGSKRNIEAHYDLSNELFETFLDKRLVYSSAYYKSFKDTLDQAQENKLKRICQKLDLQSHDHLLEIGTGWGGLAVYAAENFGCRVTTTTISKSQYDYAKARIKEKNLENQIELRLDDYRDLGGKYDKVVSIEMIEAVGHQFLGIYLEKISQLLKPDGKALIQAITINCQEYDRAVQEVDFIKKYIFPGSFIPSIHQIIDKMKMRTDLRLYHLEDFSDHYAKTLEDWRQRFLSQASRIRSLGFSEDFIRLWDFYFCYCSGGFKERAIGCAHLIFGKPFYREDVSRLRYD